MALSLLALSSCLQSVHKSRSSCGKISPPLLFLLFLWKVLCGGCIQSSFCFSYPIQYKYHKVLLPPNEHQLLQPIPRELKIRAPAKTTRKPKGYWKNLETIESELRDQWKKALFHVNTTTIINDKDLSPPPIPNESLLRYWKRHDLRNAIRSFGGRWVLQKALEEKQASLSKRQRVYVVPGKWKTMVSDEHPLIQLLLESDPNLHPNWAPVSSQQWKRLRSKRYDLSPHELEEWKRGRRKWSHRDNYTRRPKRIYKTWSKTAVESSLMEYLHWRKTKQGIPSVWMPKLCEFDDPSVEMQFGFLKHAIRNHYDTVDQLAASMGLVPSDEWKYLEGQHDLMVSLKNHIDQSSSSSCSSSNYKVFPDGYSTRWRVSKSYNDKRLFHLVKDYGGKDFVSKKLGMDAGHTNPQQQEVLYWGPFDLEFGISLMEYVRWVELLKTTGSGCIFMPQRIELLACPIHVLVSTEERPVPYSIPWGEYLHQTILLYGGYENVARRLGLAWRG